MPIIWLVPTGMAHWNDLEAGMTHPNTIPPTSVATLGVDPNHILVVSAIHLLNASRPTSPADGVPLPELIGVVRTEPAGREFIFAFAANCRL